MITPKSCPTCGGAVNQRAMGGPVCMTCGRAPTRTVPLEVQSEVEAAMGEESLGLQTVRLSSGGIERRLNHSVA